LVFRGRTGVLHNNCFKVRPKPELNDDYLFWWLQSPVFRNRITVLASKAAQPDITHTLFKAQSIFVPPLAFQVKAAEIIFEISEETQRLESLYQRKLAALDELKKSLLHQAFSGML
jgi:type I restriction enzyme S subunit